MATATMTSKGRVTVPKQVRQRLRLKPRDRVAFRDRPDGTIEFAAERVALMSLKGILKPPGGHRRGHARGRPAALRPAMVAMRQDRTP